MLATSPDKNSTARIKNEFKDWNDKPLKYVKPQGLSDGTNFISKWVFELTGPEKSYYAEGVWKVEVSLDGYPLQVPKLKFLDTIYHPSVNPSDGSISQDVYEKDFNASKKIKNVVGSVISALLSIDNQNSLNQEASKLFATDKVKFANKVKENIAQLIKSK